MPLSFMFCEEIIHCQFQLIELHGLSQIDFIFVAAEITESNIWVSELGFAYLIPLLYKSIRFLKKGSLFVKETTYFSKRRIKEKYWPACVILRSIGKFSDARCCNCTTHNCHRAIESHFKLLSVQRISQFNLLPFRLYNCVPLAHAVEAGFFFSSFVFYF